jgi:Family of unknown function (DUF6232)
MDTATRHMTGTQYREHVGGRPVHALYAGPDVVVTYRWLSIRGQRYRVADLHDVVYTRGPVHSGVFLMLALAGTAALLAVPVALAGASPEQLFALAATVLAPCAAAVTVARRFPPEHELRAWYHGVRVTLYASRDRRRFGQVGRALQRAIEAVPRDLF